MSDPKRARDEKHKAGFQQCTGTKTDALSFGLSDEDGVASSRLKARHKHPKIFMRPYVLNAAISLVLFLAPAGVVAAESTSFGAKADAYLLEQTRQEEFSGTVLVATNGEVVFAKGYGLANREHDIPNTTNTIFRLASVSKQFTAMGILILQDEHKLNVTNLISQYLDDCPAAWRNITIHHLLTHTSGIINFTRFPDDERIERLPTTVAANVRRFRDQPLDFEPGTEMRYSNSGYVLLGCIIEKVSGKSYEEFVNEKIFQPLGMKHTGYDHPATILPHRAAGYTRSGTNMVNCVPYSMDLPYAAGGFYSTVGDMLIWDQALYSERLVSEKTLAAMFTEFKNHYCYGWIRDDVGGRIVYQHSGAISGFSTQVMRFPKEKIYIIVLSNIEHAPAFKIAYDLGEMYSLLPYREWPK
jgi:CubicO group peptidase (beta-lactamase class C family)